MKRVRVSCKSVVGGWQTCIGDDFLIGPIFSNIQHLWVWQAGNLYEH